MDFHALSFVDDTPREIYFILRLNMKNKSCPSCNLTEFTPKRIWLHMLFGAKLKCSNCGMLAKLKTSLRLRFVCALISQITLFGSIILGLYFKSWLVFGILAIAAILFEGLFYQYGTLDRNTIS